MVLVTSASWSMGIMVQSWLLRFAGECTLWVMMVALAASPMLSGSFRARLIAAIPR
ncbi:hypothetical protein [Bradyrhizobium sp. JYMT SZCCT0428]|uniref:hypothetical protein n=1 Tax=Bradyrhizobium sp. JYMT SZCCT0428 TaxID=2807673 RepID=UPI001BAA7F93|nr:hypothetical protein [Bradyrhizobium sp. JYMT SZCCT0428]MBR1152658.1 hypothetical protein [Bradyrhizobium sp. JYMT SZCCT0428]